MLLAANSVLSNGYVTLKSAFTQSFPSVDYNVTYARRRLLQMPLACIRIEFDSGVSECFLTEHHPNANYSSLQALIKGIMQNNNFTKSDPISKEVVKSLLGLCQSDRERECLRYTVFKASGLSATQMRKQYGFESMIERSKVVDTALQHAKYIRESIEELAKSKDRSVLKVLAIASDESDSSTDESTDDDDQDATGDQEPQQQFEAVQHDVAKLVEIVRSSFFNYFEIVERLPGCPLSNSSLLELVKPELPREGNDQLLISYEAFCLDEELNATIRLREVNTINGEIVTDSG